MKTVGDFIADFLIGAAAVAVGLLALGMFMHGWFGW